MYYTFDSRIRYSEIDHHRTITLPGIINYFQDCSTFHAESIGLGGNVLKNRDRAWVLSSWQVVVEEYPVLAGRSRALPKDRRTGKGEHMGHQFQRNSGRA